MNTKQQQLLYDKGITNVPSDILCSDNALEESIGMIYDDGEHRVIQNPVIHINSGRYPDGTSAAPTVLYIHKFNNQERYIGYRSGQLVWGEKEYAVFVQKGAFELAYTSDTKVTSIGKTLIIISSGEIYYWLWKESSYKKLGNTIPCPSFEFALLQESGFEVRNSGTGDVLSYDGGRWSIDEGKQDEYNDLVVGLYSKNKVAIAQKKAFCEPFLIRTAVKLFDESYIHISAPQMLFPSVTENSRPDEITLTDYDTDRIQLLTTYCKLLYKNTSDFTDWEDIVKEVVVFISRNINIHDTSVDQEFKAVSVSEILSDGVYRTSYNGISEYHKTTATIGFGYSVLNKRDAKEIEDDLVGESVFYKIADIGLSGDSNFHDIGEKISTHTLENLTTQEVLETDEYFSYSKMCPDFIFSYNSRLNMSSVSRGFFEGFGSFMPLDQSNSQTYRFYVTIRTDSGDVTVMHEEPSTKQKQGIYFYYPDSRAKRVQIFKNGNNRILDASLKEHAGLNGAYYFKGLPSTNDEPYSVSTQQPGYENNALESLPNYIIQSEVDNPWVFKAEGYYKVSTGKILAMSSITQALSEGQFGQYPLLVFSTEGIWALSVASTGYYNAIHPMSREVCNNVKSITQTDGAVFFSSEKGLMVIVGNNVKCVSEQLSGRESGFSGEVQMGNIRDYMKVSIIAYDYRDSLLWIFNGSRYNYVYSIKSGTFGKFVLDGNYNIVNVINNYPDYLIQDNSGNIRSLLERPNINSDSGSYSGLMITRPMKLENGLALKTIMDLKNLRQMQGTLKLRIFASNNLDNWFEVTSLGGVPWKYYRFRFDLSGMKATDRFAGTIVITQERRTDKLR